MAMRAEDIYDNYIKELSILEQRRLSELLNAHLAENSQHFRRHPWRELAGKAPYPLLGEDAQTWVSRSRHEDEAHRQHNLENSI